MTAPDPAEPRPPTERSSAVKPTPRSTAESFCPSCGRAVKAGEDRIGRKETCPYCGAAFVYGDTTEKPPQTYGSGVTGVMAAAFTTFVLASAALALVVTGYLRPPPYMEPMGILLLAAVAFAGGLGVWFVSGRLERAYREIPPDLDPPRVGQMPIGDAVRSMRGRPRRAKQHPSVSRARSAGVLGLLSSFEAILAVMIAFLS